MEIAPLGFSDVMVGAELYRTLNVGAGELMSPVQTEKLKEIAEYLNGHPDPLFEIGHLSRANKNPQMSNLDFFTSYVKLSKEKSQIENKLKELNKELSHYA